MFGWSQQLKEGYRIRLVCSTASKNAGTPETRLTTSTAGPGTTGRLPLEYSEFSTAAPKNQGHSYCTLLKTCTLCVHHLLGTLFHLEVPSMGYVLGRTPGHTGLPKT